MQAQKEQAIRSLKDDPGVLGEVLDAWEDIVLSLTSLTRMFIQKTGVNYANKDQLELLTDDRQAFEQLNRQESVEDMKQAILKIKNAEVPVVVRMRSQAKGALLGAPEEYRARMDIEIEVDDHPDDFRLGEEV